MSGSKFNLQTMLLVFYIKNMDYPEIMPQKFQEMLVDKSFRLGEDYAADVLIPQLRQLLVTLARIDPLVLNWTSFPEVLLDE